MCPCGVVAQSLRKQTGKALEHTRRVAAAIVPWNALAPADGAMNATAPPYGFGAGGVAVGAPAGRDPPPLEPPESPISQKPSEQRPLSQSALT